MSSLWNSKAIQGSNESITWEEDEVALPAGVSGLSYLCDPSLSPLLVILPTTRDLHIFSSAWKQFWKKGLFLLEPVALDADSVRDLSIHVHRGEILQSWQKTKGILASTPGGIMGPLQLSATSISVKMNGKRDKSEFVQWLAINGYSRTDMVWSPGQFASRGFILDIYDPAHMYPIRIEFFDDEIEQIRSFRPSTQKSVAILKNIDIHAIKGSSPVRIDNFLNENVKVLFYDAPRLQNQGDNYKWLWENLREQGQTDSIPDWTEIYLKLSSLPKIRVTPGYSSKIKTLGIESPPSFRGNRKAFLSACSNWKKENFSVSVHSQKEIFSLWCRQAGVTFYEGSLPGGIIDSDKKLVFLSDLELAGSSVHIETEEEMQAPLEWTDSLSPGDHVIHDQHGLARFAGLEKVPMNETATEMFVLEFADKKRLMMPVEHFYQLTPLTGMPEGSLNLDRLGGKSWKRSVEKERKRAKEEAQRLTQNYARREILGGFRFSADNELTSEFEDSFPFSETADQLRAIKAVKSDMESKAPMDRLVIGDVGYGKTEVAMRACFKAVQDGKQVAVLVPTTILSQQHFQTFSERFAGFPVNIGVISRFQTKKQQYQAMADLAEGKTDIIIGTQRLLQKDIKFRELGLLIVDEEHRLGVSSKEQLKEFNELVDVLTLSATPIPRTLSMSLRSLKDMSAIKTPPENRMPVITFVGPWKKRLVEEAVKRELTRGGQVFYVHNRVKTIAKTASVLRNMFPEVSVEIAHGQMKERDLEKVMYRFYEGGISILVCTTIIESGLDVGNANTIIVDDPHEMGLAQLYQLRGRIGRRSETAYAFFLYPDKTELNQVTMERLEALASVYDPGGGFDLAMSDLALRGGGDMFGLRQHGKRSGITSALYYRFLDEEVKRLKGELYSEPEFEIQLNTSISERYIPQESVRISLYRRLMRADDIEEIDNSEKEIRDRFGPLDQNMKDLLEVCRLRIASRGSFIEKVKITRNQITLYGPEEELLKAFYDASYWMVKKGKAAGPGSTRGIVMLKDVILEYKDKRVPSDSGRCSES